MKVCLCITRFKKDLTEAISKNFYHLANKLAEKGIDVVVLTPVKCNFPFKCREIVYTDEHTYSSKFRIVSNVKSIAKFISRGGNEFDIIHVHMGFFLEAFLFGLFSGSTTAKRSLMLTVWQPYLRLNECFRLLKHFFIQPKDFLYHLLFNSFALKLFYWSGLRTFNKLVVQSFYQKKLASGFSGFIAPKKVAVIPNGIVECRQKLNRQTYQTYNSNNIAEKTEKEGEKGEKKEYSLLYIGHFTSFKGIDDLLKIFYLLKKYTKHDNIMLTLAWSGYGDFNKVKSTIIKLGLQEDIILKKKVDVCNEMAGHDLFIVPYKSTIGTSHYHNVLLEAMAAGTPVAASGIGSIPEIIKNNETGIIINPGNHRESALKIINLLNDAALRKKISANAADAFSRNFTIEINADRHIRLYNEVCR